MKLWQGMLTGQLNQKAEEFNASFAVDQRMLEEDIVGSLAHAEMLGQTKIIAPSDAAKIKAGLEQILTNSKQGALELDPTAEDVHTFVENELIELIGESGKKLHTARSRNDQVATDLRLYLKKEIDQIERRIFDYINILLSEAQMHINTVMPGYTHLQTAQPITYAHYLLAYGMMALRDLERLADLKKRVNQSPLGACALAGTSYPIDRQITADLLGFAEVMQNSLDAVSDRDFVVETHAVIALIATHLSRQAEEMIIWSSQPFHFIEIADEYATGSSIMPQKKNPDMAELIRGKSAKAIANLTQSLVMLKGLPLAYSKDLQEDKATLFEAIDQIKISIEIMGGMLKSLKIKKEQMSFATKKGYPEATDLADYLVRKGVPFRDAHHIVALVVKKAMQKGETLAELPLEVYREYSRYFEQDLYEAIDLETIVKKKNSLGGPAPEEVKRQINWLSNKIKEFQEKENETNNK